MSQGLIFYELILGTKKYDEYFITYVYPKYKLGTKFKWYYTCEGDVYIGTLKFENISCDDVDYQSYKCLGFRTKKLCDIISFLEFKLKQL